MLGLDVRWRLPGPSDVFLCGRLELLSLPLGHCKRLRASERWTRALAPGLTCLGPFHGSATP